MSIGYSLSISIYMYVCMCVRACACLIKRIKGYFRAQSSRKLLPVCSLKRKRKEEMRECLLPYVCSMRKRGGEASRWWSYRWKRNGKREGRVGEEREEQKESCEPNEHLIKMHINFLFSSGIEPTIWAAFHVPKSVGVYCRFSGFLSFSLSVFRSPCCSLLLPLMWAHCNKFPRDFLRARIENVICICIIAI